MEGVALGRLSSMILSLPGNSVTLFNLRPTEQGTQIFYSTLPGEQ